ncbi:MAG: MBL fold metallo-hydrolase [Alphaproteobacteria bacterium]|nr:MBL fold metallo-hydrolase [Alphaproteobacteria bacterium]
MAKAFAAQADQAEKRITFSRLSEHAYAFTAEGDPNSGVIVGDDAVMVIDAQATPKSAADVIERVRSVTDKPIRYVVLSNHHAVRTLGASAYEGAQVICSEATREMIVERGAQGFKAAVQRYPRLFKAADTVPGLTHPAISFGDRISLWLGKLQVDLIQVGRGATKGDTVVWLPEGRILFAGELVQAEVALDTGDAQFKDWPATLQKLLDMHPEALLPGRGEAALTEEEVAAAINSTQAFVEDLYRTVSEAALSGGELKEAYAKAVAALRPRYGKWALFEALLPFGVARAYDEAKGLDHPKVWTPERDQEVWSLLEPADAAAT